MRRMIEQCAEDGTKVDNFLKLITLIIATIVRGRPPVTLFQYLLSILDMFMD